MGHDPDRGGDVPSRVPLMTLVGSPAQRILCTTSLVFARPARKNQVILSGSSRAEMPRPHHRNPFGFFASADIGKPDSPPPLPASRLSSLVSRLSALRVCEEIPFCRSRGIWRLVAQSVSPAENPPSPPFGKRGRLIGIWGIHLTKPTTICCGSTILGLGHV